MGDLGESGSRIFVGASLSPEARNRLKFVCLFFFPQNLLRAERGPCLAGYSLRSVQQEYICLCLVDPLSKKSAA
jgi:hypothetical protein